MKINKVVVDTNALIYSVQRRRDIFEDLTKYLGSFELVVLKKVERELERRAASGKSGKAHAKIARELIEKMKIADFGNEAQSTDSAIMDYAEENDAYVFTYDKKLKAACKKRKIKLVRMEEFGQKIR